MEHNQNFDNLLNVSAAPQDDRVAAFVAESKNNRNRCYELSEQMTEQVASDGQVFQTYLDIQSRFERYTANNALLIMAQKPDAKRLGDYGYWKDRGAYIKRGERRNPILIMEPGKEYQREDGTVGTYYNAKKVYDISQTTLSDQMKETAPPEGKLLVRAVVSNPPVSIVAADETQMPENRGAFFEPEENCIYVRKGMDASAIVKNLAPELAHAQFADGDKDYERGENAFHAYCAGYMVCRKYGIDTREFDFDTAPDMFEGMEPQEVRGELSKIRNAANTIFARMEKVLEISKNQNLQQAKAGREETR